VNAVLVLLALRLIELTGPDDQHIEINPSEIVSLRAPRGSEHFAPGINCLVSTADGKYVGVVESCEAIARRMMEDE
jgi:hypothetical protein